MSIAPTETLAYAPILNAQTRCDACRSRAYVIVILRWSPTLRQGGELMFCAHDYKRHEQALQPFIAQLIDERYTLTKHIEDDKGVR